MVIAKQKRYGAKLQETDLMCSESTIYLLSCQAKNVTKKSPILCVAEHF